MLASFSLKSLFRNKTRTGLTVFGLAIAVMGVISLLSISAGLRESVFSSLEKSQLVIVTKKDVVSPTMSTLDASVEHELRKVSGLRDAVKVVVFPAPLETGGYGQPMFVFGISSSQEKNMRSPLISAHIISGSMFSSDSSNQVVLSKKIADKYDKKVGSTIVLAGKKYKVSGIADPKISLLQNAIIMPFETARLSSGKGEDKVSAFFVEPDDPSQLDALARRIELSVNGVSAKSASELAGTVSSLLTQVDAFFVLISSFSIIVGGLIVMNTMYMNVLDRVKEIGVLRAMGWTKDDVIKEMLLEAFLIGVLVSVTGVLLSYVLKYAVIDQILSFNTAITVPLMLEGAILSVSICLFGGIYPSLKAASIDPVVAIREE